jgi:NAD(P)H-flavin reductase
MAQQAALRTPRHGFVRLRLDGSDYECREGESVLEALLRQCAAVPYSCRKGLCLACMLKCTSGAPPAEAQEGLKDSLRLQGYFLACSWRPGLDLEIALPEADGLYLAAEVAGVERLTPQICQVFLKPAQPLDYRPGQFINLRRGDGLVRSYSLASLPGPNRLLELHVKRAHGGAMSNWIYAMLKLGDVVDIQGPNGASFYVPGRPEQPLLLVGNGNGLSPLLGILRDALRQGHSGDIHVYHGSRHRDGVYLRDVVKEMAASHANLRYFPCVSGDQAGDGFRPGRADVMAFSDHPDLTGWRVYLCGYPPMVHSARKTAYLSGARLEDIYGDPFELRDLRRASRD